MTFASELTRQNAKLDAVLVIDGIPICFGTRARVHDGTGVNQPPSAPWTSVAAIIPGSLTLGSMELDQDSQFVKPAKISLEIAANALWNLYFELLSSPRSVLGADLTAAGTTIQIVNDAIFSDNQYAYIGRETVLLGSVNSMPTGVTGCTRNAIGLSGSRASSYSSADSAAFTNPGYVTLITGSPQYMAGRQCSLRLFAGDGDSAYVDLSSLRISSSPAFDPKKGTWSITLDDGMSFFARKIASGVRGVPAGSAAVADVSGSESHMVFNLGNSFWAFEWSYGNAENGHALVSPIDGSEAFLCEVDAITIGPPTYSIDIKKSAFKLRDGSGPIGSVELAGAALKRCYHFTGRPMECLLKVLLSREGDGDNHATWDVLSGRLLDGNAPPDSGLYEFCYGANVPAAMVDVTTLSAFTSVYVPGWCYTLGLRGEESLLDLMEEVAWACGGFFYINDSGQLSFRKWSANYGTDTPNYTITENEILRDSSEQGVLDESTILHTVSIAANYMPEGNEPTRNMTVVHQEVKNLYRDTPNAIAGTLKLERRALWVEGDTFPFRQPLGNAARSIASRESVKQNLQRVFGKRSRGTKRYTISLPKRYLPVVPGQRLQVTHSRLIDFAGSSLSAAILDVESVDRGNFEDPAVVAHCADTLSGKRIAPALRVASWSSPNLTLSVNNTTWGGGANPATYFKVGWTLVIHDRSSSPPFSATSSHVIAANNGVSVLQLTGAPSFTPAAGDIIQLAAYDSAADTTTNDAQGLTPHGYAFLADDSFTLGAATVDSDKWG